MRVSGCWANTDWAAAWYWLGLCMDAACTAVNFCLLKVEDKTSLLHDTDLPLSTLGADHDRGACCAVHYSAARAGGRRTRRDVPLRRRTPLSAASGSAVVAGLAPATGGAESASAVPAAARRDRPCDGEACSVSVDEQRARLLPHAGTPANACDHA